MGDSNRDESMASSGIMPGDGCAEKWALVKNPKGAEEVEGNSTGVRGYIFKFNAKRTSIDPVEMIPKSEDFRADWEEFKTHLPEKEPLYAAYEFDFKDIQSGYNDGDLEAAPTKTKLILCTWSPDAMKPALKMLVPSSLKGLQDICAGHVATIQMNCMDDCEYESVAGKLGIKLP